MESNNDNNEAFESDGEDFLELLILTPTEIMMRGLEIARYTEERIHRVKGNPHSSTTNIDRFKDQFGAKPTVVAQLWEDLQRIAPMDERIIGAKMKTFDYLLRAMYFLRHYNTEKEREPIFDISPKTMREHLWPTLRKVQSLKAIKIKFPLGRDSDIWLISVDGVHVLANEPQHPQLSQDPHFFSHKKKHAGFCYELGVDLFASQIAWMNGPFPAGPNDKSNFVNQGLKQKLKDLKKKALGDKIYNGHPNEVSTFNAYDSKAVKSFKSRAQLRHEKVNGMMKEFKCLDRRFIHGLDKFKIVYEAVAVITQYRLEHGEPLFDILAGIDLDDNDIGSDDGKEDFDSDETISSTGS